jgi:phage-related minor tail protein
MASSKIKGITIEIGGKITKLGKALEGVNKQNKDLQS